MQIDFEGQVHEFPDDFTDQDIAAALKSAPKNEPTVGNTLLGIASSVPFAFAEAAQGVKGAVGQWTGNEEMAKQAQVDRQRILAEQAKVEPTFEGDTAKALYGGAKSVAQAIPTAAATIASPPIGLTMIGGQVAGQSYGKYQARGATKGEAALGAGLEGGIEIATERLPMGSLMKLFGGDPANLKKNIVNYLLKEGFGEQAATIGADAVDTAIANPNKTWAQYLEERPGAAYQTAIATLMQVGVFGAGAKVGSMLPKATNQAEEVKNNLDNLDKTKEETQRTQGEGTLYVGKDGSTTGELPTKIQETSGEVDLARMELQNNLQRDATAREEPTQGDLFPLEPEQQNLDLVTRPNDPTPPDAGDTEKAAELRERADLELEKAKEFKEPAAPNAAPSIFLPKGDNLRREALADRKLDVTQLPSYNSKTGEFSGKELIETLHKSLADPKISLPYRTIYKFVLDAFAKLEKTGALPRFALDVNLNTGRIRNYALDRTGQGDPAPAMYDPNTDTVWFGLLGQRESTTVHEIIHALTSRMIHLYGNNHVLVKGLDNIYKQVMKDPIFAEEYGIKDLHEFVAEAFSNPDFQAKLSQIQIKLPETTRTINGLKGFVQEVMSVFGFTKHDVNNKAYTDAFERIVTLSDALMTDYVMDNSKVRKEWNDAGFPTNIAGIGQALNTATGGAVNAAKGAQSPPKIQDADTVKSDTLKSLTGEEWIPRDPEVTPELLAQIAKEKDGSSTWAFTPGALARAFISNSTLVKTIYRLMDNGYKRGDLFATRVVAPVEKTFAKILKNKQHEQISHDLIMRELGNGKEYTPDELRSAGVPENVVMAHLEFRAMMQQALEIQNKALRDLGLPTVKPIDAYMSARWSGPWRANIRDSEGKIIWQIAEQSRGMAKRAMEHIKSKQPDLVYEDIKYKQGRDRGDRVEAGYLDMLKLLDKEDPRIQTLQSIYEDYILGKTDNVASQEKHFMRKTGVKGFAGDRPWAKHDFKDMITQQFQYAKNAARWAESQAPMKKVNTLLNDPSLQETQKNNIAFSKEYAKNQLGFGTKSVFETIDNSLAKAFGVSPQKLQEYMGAAKTVFYLKVLGMSLPFAASQIVQPAITNPAWHTKLSGEGFKHNPVRTTLNSIAKGGAAASMHYARLMGNTRQMELAKKMLNDVELDAAEYLEANSVVEINPLSDIKKNMRPAAVKGLAYPFEFTIRHPELVARSMAFMGFVSHLQQSGKFDTSTKEGRMKLFQEAEDMTKISMTDYRTQERAPIFNRGGLTGDAASTLHSYILNNLAQLTKFSKMALDGNPKPLAMMVGMQAIAGGALGLWFVEDLDDLWENFKKLLPHDEFMKVKDISVKNFILDNFGDLAAYGLASAATGSNIHTRMNASDIIPVFPFEPQLTLESLTDLAPFGESAFDIGNAAFTGLNPKATEQEKMAALYKAAPVGAQGPMENLPAFNEGATSLNTKDLTLGEYRRTPEEKNLRNIGLRSTEEQKFKDKKWTLSKVEQQLQDRMSTASKKATQFVISGDMPKAEAELKKYQELGGDVEALVNGLSKAQLNRLTVELERRAIAADSQSLPAIMKLKRYVDIYGDKTNR